MPSFREFEDAADQDSYQPQSGDDSDSDSLLDQPESLPEDPEPPSTLYGVPIAPVESDIGGSSDPDNLEPPSTLYGVPVAPSLGPSDNTVTDNLPEPSKPSQPPSDVEAPNTLYGAPPPVNNGNSDYPDYSNSPGFPDYPNDYANDYSGDYPSDYSDYSSGQGGLDSYQPQAGDDSTEATEAQDVEEPSTLYGVPVAPTAADAGTPLQN